MTHVIRILMGILKVIVKTFKNVMYENFKKKKDLLKICAEIDQLEGSPY